MDWIDSGLPFEGSDAQRPSLGTLAKRDIPTCSLDESAGEVVERVGEWEVAVVVNEAGVVLGIVRAKDLRLGAGAPVRDLMKEGPSTYRPHVTPEELLPKLENNPQPWVLVTHVDGGLVGLVHPSDLEKAAKGGDFGD